MIVGCGGGARGEELAAVVEFGGGGVGLGLDELAFVLWQGGHL